MRILSIYKGFQRENIVLSMSHVASVTPTASLKFFKSQLHFSTFYIMDRKRERNHQSYNKKKNRHMKKER